MYQLLHEDLARVRQRELHEQARQSRAATQMVRLARAERKARRAEAARQRAHRRLVALGA
jgi:hypothetical protein